MTSNPPALIAQELAHGAGAILMGHFRTQVTGIETKSSAVDPVSDADRASEEYIASALRERRPDDGILSEEGASAVSRSGLTWIVDPLDGTVNFLYGIVNWSVSIACADEQGTMVGCVHQPTTGETFLAVRGEGAWLNGNPLTLEGGVPMAKALVATGFAYDLEWRKRWAARIPALLAEVRDIRRPGSAALDLCWVACGRVDAYIERSVMPWDWMAGALIVSEAGGELVELPATTDEPFGVAASRPGLSAALAQVMTR